MSTAYAPTHRRRRQLALGALTVLLHVLMLLWLVRAAGHRPDPAAHAARAPVAAELVALPAWRPPPVPPRPALSPPPALAPPPLPEMLAASVAAPLEPVVDAASPAPIPAPARGTAAMAAAGVAPAAPTLAPAASSGEAGDAGTVAGTARHEAHAATDGPAGQAGQGGGAERAGAVQSRQDAQAGPPAQARAEPAVTQSAASARRYKVDLPPPADITLDVERTDADGTRWSGDALLSWRVNGPDYRIQVEAGIRAPPARVNLLTQISEGKVGDDGFAPILMTEKRRGRAMTATHFNRQDGTLTFSASAARYPLAPGAQDKASVPLQLAAIARGDPKQLSGNIDILVGEERDASVFTFMVVGRETIDTRLGSIATWHLVRPPGPGAYGSRLELWLAPGHGWYPVQVRNVEANGAVTTRTVNNIVIKQAGS